MEDKRFGVKTVLINELRRFQESLKVKRKRMPFQEFAFVSVNDSGVRVQKLVQASEKRMSIIPSAFRLAFRPPRQILDHIDALRIRVMMDVAVFVTIEFNCEEHKRSFVTSLGDLNVSSDKDSPPRES